MSCAQGSSEWGTCGFTRRSLIQGTGAMAAAVMLGGCRAMGSASPSTAASDEKPGPSGAVPGRSVQSDRIQQSIVFWCFNSSEWKWDIEKTCQVANELGLKSVELVDRNHWPRLKHHGLICAIAPNGMPGAPFVKGLNNPRYHDEVVGRTRTAIEACAEWGFPSVIAFTGYKWRDAEDPGSGEIPLDEGAASCVKALKELAVHAVKNGVTVCLEMLNTRDGTHPMKGHPGYQGDHLDYCADIVRRVGSPRVKLLYDIYHVQIMDGDVIRRIQQYGELIGHVHTAGNPGRGELDGKQEINYPAVMRALAEVGYKGYVGQEFIPTRDPAKGLAEAVALCDV